MDSNRGVFLTGATGLIGSYLLKILLENNHKVWALARSRKNISALERVKRALMFWDADFQRKGSDLLTVLDGDISQKSFGLKDEDFHELKNNSEDIFHCAALLEFNWSLDQERMVNKDGTKNVLDFALGISNLRKVTHLSTAYICGKHKGVFRESDVDIGQQFHNTYEQSKLETELLIQAYRKKGLWVDIFRPPLVLGESLTGKVNTFRHLYQILRMWSLETFDVFPGADLNINIIPVDVLAKSIFLSSVHFDDKNRTYHPFNNKAVNFREVLDSAAEVVGFKKPELIDYADFNLEKCSAAQKIMLENSMYYLNPGVRLNSEETNAVFEEYDFYFSAFEEKMFSKLLNYLVGTGFLKNKKETHAYK